MIDNIVYGYIAIHKYKSLTIVVFTHQMFYHNGIIIYYRGLNVNALCFSWAYCANLAILKARVAGSI